MEFLREAGIILLSVSCSILIVQCASDIIKKSERLKFDREQDTRFRKFKCWLDTIGKNSDSTNLKKDSKNLG